MPPLYADDLRTASLIAALVTKTAADINSSVMILRGLGRLEEPATHKVVPNAIVYGFIIIIYVGSDEEEKEEANWSADRWVVVC